MKLRIPLLSVVLAVFAAGCGTDAREYQAAADLLTDVRAAGFGCDDEPVVISGGPGAKFEEAMSCTLGSGTGARFLVFSGAEQKTGWLMFGSLTGGVVVEGPNWIVSVEDVDVASGIANELGGEVIEQDP